MLENSNDMEFLSGEVQAAEAAQSGSINGTTDIAQSCWCGMSCMHSCTASCTQTCSGARQ